MADDIFNYLNEVYSLLSEKDRYRFADTWKAYEQTYGDVWTKVFERGLAVNVNTTPLYNNQRWLSHKFDSTTKYSRSAVYRGNQDLSKGINLSVRYLVKISVDGASPIEVDLRGVDPTSTKNYEIVNKINAAFGFEFASLVVLDALVELTSKTAGPSSSITFYVPSAPAADASALIFGLDSGDFPETFPTFKYAYLLQDASIVGIPTLQNKIHDNQATVVLQENTDYSIEFGTGIISFKVEPPELMWAKNNLMNLETPYNNFGYLMDFYDKNSPEYLKAVQGLWFAYWTGPRPENIKRALYLLFGLPTASKDGVVTKVTGTTITLTYTDASTEDFAIPVDLVAIVAEGEAVTRFQPLVDGIDVFDKVNKKGFVETEVGRYGLSQFLTEKATLGIGPDTDETKALKTVEENVYLPQINVNAFISENINLGNVKTFLRNIQPKSRTFMFQVLVGTFLDRLELDEKIGIDINFDVTPNIDSNMNTDAQQSDLDDAETNPLTGIILDSEGMALSDKLDIEVYQFAVLVDSFSVEA